MPNIRVSPAAVIPISVPLGGVLHSCVIYNRNAANPVEVAFEYGGAVFVGIEVQANGALIINHWDTSKDVLGKIHTDKIWINSPNAAACDVDILYTTKSP